jgi:hypothetical protein
MRLIRLPNALSPGQNRRASTSSTITTSGAPRLSSAVKSRPARSGTPIARK